MHTVYKARGTRYVDDDGLARLQAAGVVEKRRRGKGKPTRWLATNGVTLAQVEQIAENGQAPAPAVTEAEAVDLLASIRTEGRAELDRIDAEIAVKTEERDGVLRSIMDLAAERAHIDKAVRAIAKL